MHQNISIALETMYVLKRYATILAYPTKTIRENYRYWTLTHFVSTFNSELIGLEMGSRISILITPPLFFFIRFENMLNHLHRISIVLKESPTKLRYSFVCWTKGFKLMDSSQRNWSTSESIWTKISRHLTIFNCHWNRLGVSSYSNFNWFDSISTLIWK